MNDLTRRERADFRLAVSKAIVRGEDPTHAAEVSLRVLGSLRPVELTASQATVMRRDVQELLPHLQGRGEDYARDARKLLIDRGAAEAKTMRDILETQRKQITDVVVQYIDNAATPRLVLVNPYFANAAGTEATFILPNVANGAFAVRVLG